MGRRAKLVIALVATFFVALPAIFAIACAVPVSASAAAKWTHEDEPLEAGEIAAAPFEGLLTFASGPNGFGCEFTVLILAEPPNIGDIIEFVPTTQFCSGTGILKNCTLDDDWDNANAAGYSWGVELAANGKSVTIYHTEKLDLTFHHSYGSCPVGEANFEVKSLLLTPTLNAQNTITKFAVAGTTTSGLAISGTLEPECKCVTLGIGE